MSTLTSAAIAAAFAIGLPQEKLPYPIVDTGQKHCYDETVAIEYPKSGEPFYGQDAQYAANPPSYRDNGDGTVSDLVTGLMWTRDPGEKQTLARALEGAPRCRVGRHEDWRLPTIKELYSLILFSGTDPDPSAAGDSGLVPFIDTSVFTDFEYADPAQGQRVIDAQYATCTRYVSTTMQRNETMFGVNFADGRIKGYPIKGRRGESRYYVLYVRGNPEYGKNEFVDNGDGTITDQATGLTWMQDDSGKGLNWRDALEYAESLELAGHDDWRLPSAKELQSIVDYSRSPDTTDSAAIDPVFQATAIENEGGERDFGSYWTSSSHRRGAGARSAVYVAFGRALGFMKGRGSENHRLLDVHGAGAQRSDPKSGDASRFPQGRGPQGDVIRIENMVRCVRGGGVETVATGPKPVEQDSPPRDRRPGDRPERRGEDGSRFLRRFDKNGDGRVTREEFDGPSRRFDRLDRDGDGVVTAEEAAAAPPGRRGPPPEDRPATPTGEAPDPPRKAGEAPAVPGSTTTTSSPNFVLILTDDMGWTGLSVQIDDRIEDSRSDFYQTPNIAKLAEEGMRFSRAYSPGALCTPSRASILTGKTPARLHITTPGGGRGKVQPYMRLVAPAQLRKLPAAETTIAEALEEVGYTSAHLGKWHLGRSDPGEHGFDVHDGSTANGGPGAYQDPNPKDIFGLTERAIAFMEEQSGTGTPFYLQLSHYAVHVPVEALETSRNKFEDLPSGDRHDNVEFAAMTYDLDSGVGLLLSAIDRLELTESTFVVLMSDNGAASPRRRSQNTPLRRGKGTFYEGGIRVPLVVRGPGIEPGTFCRENVAGYDLFPTICDWAGVESPSAIDGVSLVPLLEGDPGLFERPDEALLFHYPHYGEGPAQKPQSAIILDDYKLIRDLERGTSQLFHLGRDISEERDLAGREPDRAERMEQRLDAMLEAAGAQLPTENPDFDPNAARPGRK